MDPQVCLDELIRRLQRGDKDAWRTADLRDALVEWVGRGGFKPHASQADCDRVIRYAPALAACIEVSDAV